MEEKKTTTTRKTTAKKATTTRKRTTTKKVDTKKEEVKEEKKKVTLDDISPELLQQIMSLVSQGQDLQDKKEDNKIKEENNSFSKADLYKIRDEEILVKSLFDGVLNYNSPKTHISYRWEEKGSTELMTVNELLSIPQRFLKTPWIEPMDDRVKSGLGLEKIFDTISEISDVDNLIEKNDDELEKLLNSVSKDFKECIAGEIYNKVRNEELTNIITIRKLEKIFNKDFLDDEDK